MTGRARRTSKNSSTKFEVDKGKLRALHGNAVLSRYPIRSARLVPFTVGYDWFTESKIRPLEKAKRQAARLVGEDLTREVRRGQRTTLYVDLDVPSAPGGKITIAATHLENRTKPKTRRKQLEELLKDVHELRDPVVIGGDMNTTGANSTPTSIENFLYKRYGDIDFWTTKGIMWTTGAGLVYTGSKAFHSFAGIQYRVDPSSVNIPGVSPNLERGFFKTLGKYRFGDGTASDLRGVSRRSTNGRARTLSDSNQRQSRGFTPTFVSELIWGRVRVARFKTDWIFVNGEMKDPRDKHASCPLAPHFGRTLVDLNNGLPEPISDHSPMIVDLPFKATGSTGDSDNTKTKIVRPER